MQSAHHPEWPLSSGAYSLRTNGNKLLTEPVLPAGNVTSAGRPGIDERDPERRFITTVLASPGDVKQEREIAVRVIEEVNRTTAADRGLFLDLRRWETDAYAGFHLQGPQGICDEALNIEDSGIVLGVFWTRFGKPAADGQTGTEHEIAKAIDSWRTKGLPQIMIFFNNAAPSLKSSSDRRQWAQVAEYREALPAEGLYWEYEGVEGFERQLRHSLSNYIRHSFPLKNGSSVRVPNEVHSRAAAPSTQVLLQSEAPPARPGDTTVSIDPRLSPDVVQGFLAALADFHRACGGLGLQVSETHIQKRGGDQSDA
jgi:hypothetical protein